MNLKLLKKMSGILILGWALLGLLFLTWRFSTNRSAVDAQTHFRKNERSLEAFCLEGVRWHGYKEDRPLFFLRADKIVPRNCRFGYLVFFNLKEIFVSNLRIDIYNREGMASQGGAHPWGQVVRNIGETLTCMGDSVSPKETGLSDTDSTAMVRVNIENVTLVIHIQPESQVSFSSDTATVQDPRKIVFKGNFSIISADGMRLTAPEAVWLCDQNGLYFPKGYESTAPDHSRGKNDGFFSLTDTGLLVSSPPCAALKANPTPFDNIERVAARHLSKLQGRIFPYLFHRGANSRP